MILIRWRVLLRPVCWVRVHRLAIITAGTWADRDYEYCTRCLLEIPADDWIGWRR